ncbi:zinc-finger-containing protein [Oscillospiraceae bacterium 50-60]
MRQTSKRGKRWNTKDESGQVRCHCGRPAVLCSAEGICKTHRPGAKVYVCSGYPACNSFVMAHPGTLEPMGTLALPELRRLQYEAHQQFDQLHKSALMTRWEAYQWLAYITQAPMSHAHIGHLGEYYCKVVIRESRKLLAQRTGMA